MSKDRFKILQVLEPDQTDDFLDVKKEHHRLGVFHEKGKKCVNCGLEGNRIVLSKDNGGGVHWDLFSFSETNRILMTVDHIIPRSKGGKNFMTNKQPMCEPCNTKKGAKLPVIQPTT